MKTLDLKKLDLAPITEKEMKVVNGGLSLSGLIYIYYKSFINKAINDPIRVGRPVETRRFY